MADVNNMIIHHLKYYLFIFFFGNSLTFKFLNRKREKPDIVIQKSHILNLEEEMLHGAALFFLQNNIWKKSKGFIQKLFFIYGRRLLGRYLSEFKYKSNVRG